MMEKQFKPIIYDYKEFVTYLPNSFYYNPKKPYQDIINNISNNSNISNNLNSIMSYTNNKEEDNLDYYKKYNKIKITSGNLTLNRVSKGKNIDINVFPNNRNRISFKNRLYNSLKYKAMNNINNTFSYNYSNTYNNNIYNYKSPKPSSLKIKKFINDSNIKSKSKNKKYSITNIIIVKNNLNKWVKNRIQFDYKPHEIDKYKKLMPNKNFIKIISHKRERRLFLYYENKETIPKPKIKIKKNKGKSNLTNKININEGNLKKLKSMVNKNKINKVNRKQKLLNKYFINDTGNNEPPLNIENKLIMKKPIFLKKED